MINSKLNIYCISIDPTDLQLIKKMGYIPTGLGDKNFSNEWHLDNKGSNISHKNKWYSEFTFHYWFWKNKLKYKDDNNWDGFCAYRDFWANEEQYEVYLKDKANYHNINTNNYQNINNIVINSIPKIWNDFDVILGHEIFLNNHKFSKILKYGKLAFLNNLGAIFNKKGGTIKFHFEMFHGKKFLDEAINCLDSVEKKDFLKFVSTEASFNRGCMFICRSKIIMDRFYNSLFPWLERCEKVLGLEDRGYETRIYAFLAERYMSYWFKKYSNYLEWPVITFNIPRKNN